MGDLLQFVDTISSSPTVLLDLNNENPFAASQINFAPPRLRRASSSSMLSDGSTVSASSYDDRDLSLTLDLVATTQDLNAASLQTLARLLDRDGCWLKWQPTGMTHPVFFRTKRADVNQINDVVGAAAYRTVDLTVPAEPAAYGLAETGSFTVNNDPAHATNPCFYQFVAAVKGDLTAPLILDMTNSFPGFNDRTVLASSQALAGVSQTAPYLLQSGSFTNNTTGSTWTLTSVSSDAAMSAGNAQRFAPNAAIVGTWTTACWVDNALTTLPPGEYRALLRVRKAAAADVWFVRGRQHVGTIPATDPVQLRVGETVTYEAGTSAGPHYLDLGVFRFPFGSPEVSSFPATPSYGAGVRLAIDLRRDVAGSTLDIDCLLLVPVNVDQAVSNRYSATKVGATVTVGPARLRLDGVGDSRWVRDVSNVLAHGTSVTPIGDLPELVPGADNALHLVRQLDYTKAADGLTNTTIVDWTYYPRYLYVRGATT